MVRRIRARSVEAGENAGAFSSHPYLKPGYEQPNVDIPVSVRGLTSVTLITHCSQQTSCSALGANQMLILLAAVRRSKNWTTLLKESVYVVPMPRFCVAQHVRPLDVPVICPQQLPEPVFSIEHISAEVFSSICARSSGSST